MVVKSIVAKKRSVSKLSTVNEVVYASVLSVNMQHAL